jgi:hypothetical protein
MIVSPAIKAIVGTTIPPGEPPSLDKDGGGWSDPGESGDVGMAGDTNSGDGSGDSGGNAFA